MCIKSWRSLCVCVNLALVRDGGLDGAGSAARAALLGVAIEGGSALGAR